MDWDKPAPHRGYYFRVKKAARNIEKTLLNNGKNGLDAKKAKVQERRKLAGKAGLAARQNC
jgi:hypothetical protein